LIDILLIDTISATSDKGAEVLAPVDPGKALKPVFFVDIGFEREKSAGQRPEPSFARLNTTAHRINNIVFYLPVIFFLVRRHGPPFPPLFCSCSQPPEFFGKQHGRTVCIVAAGGNALVGGSTELSAVEIAQRSREPSIQYSPIER